MKSRLLLLLLSVFGAGVRAAPENVNSLPSRAGASARLAEVQVRVRPDHADWIYALGESVKFQVTVAGTEPPAGRVRIKYQLGPEQMPAEEKTAVVPAEGLTIDGGTLREPGFLRCLVTAEVNGKAYRGLATAGFAPEKIRPTQTEPADFDGFWAAGKAMLAQIPLDARLTLQPSLSTPKFDLYHVSFQNFLSDSVVFVSATYSRIYGILCVPKGPGPFPALLRPPGAAVRSYNGVRDLAEKGIITLEIGIHGIPVNLPNEIYAQLASGALRGYPSYNLDNKDTYYYRRVYLGCVRANDFLCSLEKWDRRNLIVAGHSQGGLLAIATAVLDPRVTALVAVCPAYCDVTGYLHGRAGGWPPLLREASSGHRTPGKIATTTYYDAVNFARRLRTPGFYTWGFNDDVTAPTSCFAAYNVITAPKELFLVPEAVHGTSSKQSERINRWILARLSVKPAAAQQSP